MARAQQEEAERVPALLAAAPLAALALVLTELARVPGALLGDGRLLGALGQLVRSAPSTFGVSALLLLAAALALRLARRRPLALGALGVAQAGVVWLALVDDDAFLWHPVVALASLLLAAALALAHVALAASLPRRGLLAIVVVALSLGLARAHYGVLVGQYPNVHAAAVRLAFVGLSLGLAHALIALARPALARPLAVGLAALLFAGWILDPPARAAARPYVMAYTELGRGAGVAEALERDRAGLFPTTLPGPRPRDGLLRRDPDARRRFARHSGLPTLPAGFELGAHDVLLVLSDATRHDRAYPAMPHLSALAAGAQRFDRALAPSNGTFPSLASMLAMTPVSFAELDVRPRFWRGRLREERTTAVEAMRAAGRATFWVGHDHRGCFTDHLRGLEQGFDAVTRVHQAHGDPRDAHVDARIAELAVEAIARHRAAGERFFGLVFFVSPHDDYQSHGGPGAATELERYDEELAFTDAQLARVLAALDDDTVVVFAGDHGEAFGEHGHRHHLTSLHDEQIHVPLVVRLPGLPPAAHAAPTSTSYVLPWLLAAGAPEERAAAERALTDDLGPMMRALDGAVLSEMIGPRAQHAAFAWPEHTVVYDVFADLARIYDARRDPRQEHDLREAAPALLARVSRHAHRYRAARFAGRRFRFVGED